MFFLKALHIVGIEDEVYTLVNNIQIRPDCSIIVSRSDAYDFLNNSKPVLINLVERYYEVVVTSGEYTGYSSDVKLVDFYSALKDPTIEPVAILGGINAQSTHNLDNDSNYIDKDSSYKAGEALIEDKNSLEIMGLAVFRGDKLIGELNGIETISYLLVTGKLQNCSINIPNPFITNDLISLSIRISKSPDVKVDIVNDSPYIKPTIYVEASILSLDSDSDYTSSDTLQIIREYVNSYLENHITEYLYKTSHDFKSDINGFGRKTLKDYLTLSDWEKLNWLENYENSAFNVKVSSTLKTASIILKN